jgi:hypothetical protein
MYGKKPAKKVAAKKPAKKPVKKVPAGYHRMPDGSLMKGKKHGG